MDPKQQVIDAGIRMLKNGITIGAWGNISLRDPESGLIYLTPSGMAYDTLVREDIVVLTPDGTIREGKRKPSVEKELHLSVYRARPEVNAVVHTHPIYSTAFSSMGEGIPLLLDEAAQVLGAPVQAAKYALPGSPELARSCVEALGTRPWLVCSAPTGRCAWARIWRRPSRSPTCWRPLPGSISASGPWAGATAPFRRTISPPCSTSSATVTASNERKRPRRSAGTICAS